jgi:hypothetical protein
MVIIQIYQIGDKNFLMAMKCTKKFHPTAFQTIPKLVFFGKKIFHRYMQPWYRTTFLRFNHAMRRSLLPQIFFLGGSVPRCFCYVQVVAQHVLGVLNIITPPYHYVHKTPEPTYT